MKIQACTSFFLFLVSLNVSAEYRVYQYQVENKMRTGLKDATRIVTSSLDPVSYLSYHGGSLSTRISLLRSWHCVGYTGNQKQICRPPLERLEDGVTGEN